MAGRYDNILKYYGDTEALDSDALSFPTDADNSTLVSERYPNIYKYLIEEEERDVRQTILPQFTEKLEEGRLLTGAPDIEPPRQMGVTDRMPEPVQDMPQEVRQEQPILSNPYMYGGLKEPVPMQDAIPTAEKIKEIGTALPAGIVQAGQMGMRAGETGTMALDTLGPRGYLARKYPYEVQGKAPGQDMFARGAEYLEDVYQNNFAPKYGGAVGTLRSGLESAVTSLTIGTPTAVLAGMTGGLAPVIGFALGAGGIFGAAEYSQFLADIEKEARAAGASDAEVESLRREFSDNAMVSALAETGFEVGSDLLMGKFMGLLGNKSISPAAKKGVINAVKNGVSRFTKNYGKVLATEIPSEGFTAGVQNLARRDTPIEIRDEMGEQVPAWKSAVDVAAPTAVSGLVFAGAGMGAQNLQRPPRPPAPEITPTPEADFQRAGAVRETPIATEEMIARGGVIDALMRRGFPQNAIQQWNPDYARSIAESGVTYDEYMRSEYPQSVAIDEEQALRQSPQGADLLSQQLRGEQEAVAAEQRRRSYERSISEQMALRERESMLDAELLDSPAGRDIVEKRIALRNGQINARDRYAVNSLIEYGYPSAIIQEWTPEYRMAIAERGIMFDEYLDTHPDIMQNTDISMAVNEELNAKAEQEIARREQEQKEIEGRQKRQPEDMLPPDKLQRAQAIEEQLGRAEQIRRSPIGAELLREQYRGQDIGQAVPQSQPPQVEQIIQPKETIERKPYERIRHDAKGNAILHPRALAEDDIRALPHFDNLGVVGRGGYVIEPSLTRGRFNLIHKTPTGNIVKVPGQQNVTKASAEKFIQDNGGNVYVGEIYDKLGSVRVGTGAVSRPLLDTNKFFDTSEDEFADNYAQAMRDNYGEAFGEGTAHRYTLSSIANEAEDELGRIYSGDTGQTADERNTYQGMTKDEYDAAVEWYNSITREFPDITADELNAIRRGEFTEDDLRQARSLSETEADAEADEAIRAMESAEVSDAWDAEVERLKAEEQATTPEDVERFTRGEQVEGIISKEPDQPRYARSGYNDAWSRTTSMIDMNDSLTGKPIPIGSPIYVNDLDARILSPESHSALMQNPQRQTQYEAEYEQGGKERAQEARKQFKRLNIDPNQLNMFDASEQMKMSFMAEKGYNNKESGGGVTDEDVRKLFHYADDFGITSDGGMYATIKNRVFKIYNVKFINPDTAAFMAEYGREFDPKQDKIVGASLNSVLFITREGDRWTMAHEFYHELEKMGVVTEADVKTIKRTVASLRGKKLSEVTPYEEAAFVHEGLRRRAYQRDTMVGRVLQKIQDFIDGLVNIFRKTGEGVIRNIESGQIFERDAQVASAAVNYMAAEEQWKQDESNLESRFAEFEKYLDEDSKRRIKEWWFAGALTPLSTRVRKYSLPVYSRLMNFEHDERKAIMKDNSEIVPFIVKYREMTDADKTEFEFAAFNEDQYKIDEFLTKYNMNKEYNAFRKVMDGIYDRLVAAGYKVNYHDFYFPRMVKDLRGYLDYLYGTEEKDAILEAIKQEEKSNGKPLTPEEQFAVANNVIRGYAGKVTLAGPGNIKPRTVQFVNENNRQFYYDMTEAMFRYIVRANRAIETKNFFGKHLKVGRLYSNAIESGVSDNPVPLDVIEDSIGAMLLEQDMRPENRNKLKDLLQARFNFVASPEWIQKFKMLGYVTAMGSGFNSAISQIADVGISAYMGGLNAAPEFGKAVFRNLVDDVYVRYNPYYQKDPDKVQALHDKIDNVIKLYGSREFTLEGLGIESMGSEFRGTESFNKWLEKVFNMTFIHAFDVAGKETLVNSTYKRMVREAQTGNWKRNHAKILFDAFAGDREKINQVTQDLADGKKTEDIDFLMNVVLSNFQPIWLSETTEGYLRNPKARAFYTLKTFLLKQIDAIRRQSLDDIVRGIRYGKEGKISEGAKLTGQGLASMIHLGGFMVLAGAGTDAIKDWILDRDIDLRDLVIDNMLRFIGLNRYVLLKSREEGLAVSAYRVVAPPINYIEDIGRDAWSGIGNYFEWRDAVAEGKTPQRFQLSKMYTWGDMPLGGQWYEYRGIPFTNLSGRGKDYQYVKRTTAAKDMAKERKLASDADHKRFMDNMIKMIDGGYINKRDAVETTRQFIETQNTMRGLALKPPLSKETVNQWSKDITDTFRKSLDKYEKRDVKLIYEMDDMNKLVRQAAELVNDQQMFDSEALDYIKKMIAAQNRLRDNYLKPKITEEQANKLSTLYVKVRKEQK